MKIKRYLVFGFVDGQSLGGWLDFRGSFDTEEEAFAFFEENKEEKEAGLDSYQVVDSETQEWAFTI